MGRPTEDGSPDATPAEIGRSSRRDWLAFLAGLLQLPLTYFVCLPLNLTIPASVSISVFLLVLAGGTGIYVGTRVDWEQLPRNHGVAVATRLGAATGLIVFLVGGGMAVVAVTLYLMRHGVASDTQLWGEVSVLHSTAVLFSLVPAIVAGSLGCLLRASAKLPPAEFSPARIPSAEEKPAKRKTRRGVILCAVMVFILSLFSPAIPQTTTPPPEPLVTSDSRKPGDEDGPLEKGSVTPPPPQFRYEPPSGLENASASEWTIAHRHTLEDLDPSGPVAISPDSRLLAYRSTSHRGELTVLDLRQQTIVRDYRSLPRIRAIAWAPNSEQIFCVCNSQDSPYWMIDTVLSRCLQLPVWPSLAPSDCRPVWRLPQQVYLVLLSTNQVRVLDLASLQLKGIQSIPPDQSVSPLPETSKCRFSMVPRVRSYEPPSQNRGGQGFLMADFGLAIIDKQTMHAFRPRGCSASRGARFIAAPDGSILVAISNSEATVFYFGLRTPDGGDVTLTTKLPELPEDAVASKLQELRDSSRLGMFVCAPLINPLNKRVIGPNREAIRGIARVLSWQGGTTTLVMADTYGIVDKSCILADLHYWQDGRPVLIHEDPFRYRWSFVLDVSSSAQPSSAEEFPRWFEPEFQTSEAGFVYRGHHGLFANNGSLRLTSTERAGPAKTAHSKAPVLQRQPFPTKKAPDGIARQVDAFVRAHHEKVTRRDLQGYANDYHHIVDFYDHGPVSRSTIQKDQADYLPKYIRLSETVVGNIQTRKTANNVYHLTYNMRSVATRLDGSGSNKLIQITMTIGMTGDRFVIHREKSKVLEDGN